MQPLRADSNQHLPSCGFQAPAFGGPRTGLSHSHANAGHDFAFFDNAGFEPATVGVQGRCSIQTELVAPTDTSVSHDSISFWPTEYHSRHVFLLPDTRRSFGTLFSSCDEPIAPRTALSPLRASTTTTLPFLVQIRALVRLDRGTTRCCLPTQVPLRPRRARQACRPAFFPSHTLHPYRHRFGR